jgi:uncharacterized protein (DUF2147 family)
MRRKRAIVAMAAVVLVGLCPMVQSNAAGAPSHNDVIGEWKEPDGDRVQIFRCNDGKICGRIVKVLDPSRKDLSNPDARLRARPVVGIQVLRSRRRSGPHGWRVWLYRPESGQTLKGRVTPIRHNALQVSRCTFFDMFCTDEIWTRVR